MDVIFQISALAVVAAICCSMLRGRAESITMALSVTACAVIILSAVQFLKPILDVVERIRVMSGISGTAAAPLTKVVGIVILTRIAGAICDDAGEKTLHQAVDIAGSLLSVYISLPLFSAVLDLLEEILTG